jgi:hypothetical protein
MRSGEGSIDLSLAGFLKDEGCSQPHCRKQQIRKSIFMEFRIPKSLNYFLDVGWHDVTLTYSSYDADLKGATCTCAEQARLTFLGDASPRSITQDAAARTFCMGEHGDDLMQFLTSWLDDELPALLNDNGNIDLDKLIGRRAQIYVQHKAGSKGRHAQPFCKIAAIRRTPRPTSQQEAA